ncbi:SpoIIE family protein phosphatase [Streptomyces sp. PLAI1-29]|uniref:SpoIIE family protein phosphatase n=1 Tax=Streptomyces zingiberis TaxID=2053010 RepID=A0ABX1BX68_9ACTN|nr:SpoIIE family protein phosphatase [Streptomyces zingiberis]
MCSQSPAGADAGAGTGVGGAWLAAPCPVLVVDRSGTVRGVNRAAAELLPAVVTCAPLAAAGPAWLALAHQRLVTAPGAGSPGPASGQAGERWLEAHPSPGENGAVVWWLTDLTDRHRAEEAERAVRVERRRTAFLAEASNQLLASLNPHRCMEVTAQLAARHLADAAVVVAPETDGRLPLTYCAPEGRVSRGDIPGDPRLMPGLSEALQGFPPVPSRWIDPASAPAWAVPPGFEGPVGSMAVTPLPGHGVPAGALILVRRSDQACFSESEELLARVFAARAGAAMSAARLYAEQAAITSVLMRELLPPSLGRLRGIDFAGRYRPSDDSERIGGDFYNVHPGPGGDEECLAVLGDVCGKGLEAAALTGKIRNTVHALLPMATDHLRLLNMLNSALLGSGVTRFATLVLASAVRRGGAVDLRLTSAGHPAPLVVRADGEVEEAETRGCLVGVLPEVRARTATARLAPGETCLLYTDGITEAKGGPFGDEQFGEQRLRAALAECAGAPAEAVAERVQMLAAQWVGSGRHDDMAVVAIGAPRAGLPGGPGSPIPCGPPPPHADQENRPG